MTPIPPLERTTPAPAAAASTRPTRRSKSSAAPPARSSSASTSPTKRSHCEIHEGLEVVETWNSANAELFHAKNKDLTGPDREEQEISMPITDGLLRLRVRLTGVMVALTRHTMQLFSRYGNSGRKFAQIDGYVNERLAILASAKHGLQGRNWVDRFNYEWVNQLGVYRLNGTVKPTLAYASR